MQQEVTFYPYRTAMVRDHFMKVTRQACKGLEEELAGQAGVRPDNHTAYKVVHKNFDDTEEVTYIWFTDFSVIFGRSIEERNW